MRPFLLALIAAAALTAFASAAAEPPAYKLIPGGFTPGRQPDGNTIIFEGKDGLVVVDTGRHVEHQAAILAHARERAKPITTIVNTHWHLDHAGGNAEIRSVYPQARIHASDAVAGALSGFLARSLAQGRAHLADPAIPEPEKVDVRLDVEAIADPANLLPDVTVAAPLSLPLGEGRRLELRLAEHAATRGDVWLYDPAGAVLVAGDLVVLPAPFFDTACPEGWSKALAQLAAVPFETLIPGHGPALSWPQFDLYRKAFDRLLACAAGKGEDQTCIDGWLRDAAPVLKSDQERGQARMLLGYYLRAILRSAEKKKEFCPA